MKEYKLTYREIYITKYELYQLGWNGNDRIVDDIIKQKMPIGFIIKSLVPDRNGYTISLVKKIKLYDTDIENGITEVPCPTCYGTGTVEVHTSHSFDITCDRCNGNKLVPIETVCK